MYVGHNYASTAMFQANFLTTHTTLVLAIFGPIYIMWVLNMVIYMYYGYIHQAQDFMEIIGPSRGIYRT